jgi:hypothetical protein
MVSSNLATFDEQQGGSPVRHSRHASLVRLQTATNPTVTHFGLTLQKKESSVCVSTWLQAGPGSGSELGSAASGVLQGAERDGLAAPSVDWQLGALAEEVRHPSSWLYPTIGAYHWFPP